MIREPKYTLYQQGRRMIFKQTIHTSAINLVMPKNVEHLKLSFFYDEPLVGLIFNKKIRSIHIGWGMPLKVENLPLQIKTVIMNDKYSIVKNVPMTTKNIFIDKPDEVQWKCDRDDLTKQRKVPYGCKFK